MKTKPYTDKELSSIRLYSLSELDSYVIVLPRNEPFVVTPLDGEWNEVPNRYKKSRKFPANAAVPKIPKKMRFDASFSKA